MLDKNLDRMMHVIGGIILGSVIIFMMSRAYPQLFVSIGSIFTDSTHEATEAVHDIKKSNERPAVPGESKEDRARADKDLVTSSNPLNNGPIWKADNVLGIFGKTLVFTFGVSITFLIGVYIRLLLIWLIDLAYPIRHELNMRKRVRRYKFTNCLRNISSGRIDIEDKY